jgi:putative ABC transport system substrate-binding protein
MIKEVAPGIKRAGLMYNPDYANYVNYYRDPFEAAARTLAVGPISPPVRSDAEIEAAIASLGREHGGLVILPDGFMISHRAAAITAATREKVPTINLDSGFAHEGGLLSYGPNARNIFRAAAGYLDRILRGEKPADLPVQAPTKYETAINLKTAKALGLTIPETLLATADEVI